MIGRVVSTKMAKTAKVLVEREAVHPLYKKAYVRSKKYLVDNPVGASDGDVVEIIKVAPASKRKHFRIVKVMGKSMEEITEERLKEEAKEIISEVMPEKKEIEESSDVSHQIEEKVNEKQEKPKKKRKEKSLTAED